MTTKNSKITKHTTIIKKPHIRVFLPKSYQNVSSPKKLKQATLTSTK